MFSNRQIFGILLYFNKRLVRTQKSDGQCQKTKPESDLQAKRFFVLNDYVKYYKDRSKNFDVMKNY